MHGLINATLQFFVEDVYGPDRWASIIRRAGLKTTRFETMLSYDDRLTQDVVDAMASELGREPAAVLEDVGIYLVTFPKREALHALDDLPDRVRLAVPDLDLPPIAFSDLGGDRFTISCRSPFPHAGCVLMGVLRAMADDYGALVTLDHQTGTGRVDRFDVMLVQESFAAGRNFDLVAGAGS